MEGLVLRANGTALGITSLAGEKATRQVSNSQRTDSRWSPIVSHIPALPKGEFMGSQLAMQPIMRSNESRSSCKGRNAASQISCSHALGAEIEGSQASSSFLGLESQQESFSPTISRRCMVFSSAALASAAVLPGVTLAEVEALSGLDTTAAPLEENPAGSTSAVESEQSVIESVPEPGSDNGNAAEVSEALPPETETGSASAEVASEPAELAEAAGPAKTGEGRPEAAGSGEPEVTKKIFFEVAIDGEPAGRVVVGLFGKDVPIGATRFAELAIGKRGLSYRRKEFVKIYPGYVQNAGLRSFSLTGSDSDTVRFTGGETAEKLVEELEKVAGTATYLKNVPGAVSLVVIDPTIPPPKTKLIARDGGFLTVEEAAKPPPNGTEFALVLKESPEIDATNLVVGKILEGWETVEAISKVPAVKDNKSSPYFMAAKVIGDSRAVVAERGFNRPYTKVVVTKCGEVV